MKNDWKALTIKAYELEEKINNKSIQIPTYQRGVVWTIKMQKELIDSIKNGYPFGSLIIYTYGKNMNLNNKPDLLIDGLQRSTAIFKFLNNPSIFFDANDISDEYLNELIELIPGTFSSNGIKDKIKSIIIEWVKEHKTSESVRNMQSYLCAQKLMKEFPSLTDGVESEIDVQNKIVDIINPIFEQYKKLCSTVEEKDIPYIEISGDDSNLSEIFFRINDRGIKLNKQNKFAATWVNDPIKITNPNLYCLVNFVKQRYDEIASSGTAVYGYEPDTFLRKKELDVFELTYAFGKKITSDFPELFVYKNDVIAIDTVSFTLINACLSGTKDTLPHMNKLLLETFKNDDTKINQFLINIISCIKFVDELLGPVTKFKSNKRLNKSPLHTEFQIVSLIASVFKLKYVIEEVTNEGVNRTFNLSSVNPNWNNISKKLQKNALKKYILDIIEGSWSGHGDNSLDNIIHDNFDIYTRDISKSDLDLAIRNWYSRQKSERRELITSSVATPKEPEKVLLNLIYANTLTAADQLNIEKYDIEHLATKKLMETKLKKYGGTLKLPISSIGNLCLLPEYNNRKKKDLIIYDDTDYTNKLGKVISIKEIEDNYTFTKSSDMDWLHSNKLTKDEFESEYYEFIDERFKKMLEKILNILY